MNFLNDLNPVQREAVKAVNGPVMVIAGAGSGKTRVLTYRIAYLVSIGVPAYQILALTFTNKAASEMKGRIASLVGEKSRSIWMGTFHAMFARILRTEAEKIGYERSFTIYDSQDSLNAIRTVMNAAGISSQQFPPQAIRSRISNAKNNLFTPEQYSASAQSFFEEKAAAVYDVYQKYLKQNNAMDFDDLLLKPIELFRGHKKTLEQYQDRFRFILIDEYQDTNRAQYVLVNLLAAKYRNICVVGDDAQSIYAFRGADIRNILDFEKDYSDAKTFRLEQNYRSTKTILGAADLLIKNNVRQIPKTLWTDNQQGEQLTLLDCADEKDEAAQIVSQIYRDCSEYKLDLKDFAVLYRTNAQSRAVEDALRRQNVPYVIVGGTEFYDRKEIKDVLAYLRVLANPKDAESFLRIVNVPNRGIGDASLEKLKAFAEQNQLTLLEVAGRAKEITGLGEKQRSGLLSVSNLFAKFIGLKPTLSVTELSRSLVDQIGVLPLYKAEGTAEAQSRFENIQELLSAISEAVESDPEITLEGFLENVALVSDVDKWDGERNTVTLMTLHSAKGLEFPIVFVSGLEEGLFPIYADSIGDTELEEERRLLYVGMTRAMKKLYVSFARSRFRNGDRTYPEPSRFLAEIGEKISSKEAPVDAGLRFADLGEQVKGRTGRARKDDGVSKYFSDDSPDYENQTDVAPELAVGAKIEHEMFGEGTVLGLSGKGDSAKAVVLFPEVGRKMLLLKYAKLKVV
ncbi:MAG TPA: UvrD-helicase domain-containing protein [Bacteroidota bacterium]|nr:UvrD-helicase domain-containing protein [Bacteroidota bacterium]